MKKKSVEKSDGLHSNFASWGTKLKITTIGIWFHDAYTKEYAFSGAKGHYPESIYRFTQCGEASIHPAHYEEIEVPSKDFKVGYRGLYFRIDEIIEPTSETTKE